MISCYDCISTQRGELMSIKSDCPATLAGNWKDTKGNRYLISENCSYFLVGTFPYQIDTDDILHYGRGTSYQRVNGDPGSLIGTWMNEDIQEKLTFNEDGSYLVTWLDDGTEYSGTFTYTETNITSTELRASLLIDGSNITFKKSDDGTEFYGTFEIVSNDRWILRLEDLDEITYTRI